MEQLKTMEHLHPEAALYAAHAEQLLEQAQASQVRKTEEEQG